MIPFFIMFEDFERYYLNGVPPVSISVNELTAHLEGTFSARYSIAETNYDRDPTPENYIRMEEARRTYDTIYGILYEFDESNQSTGDYV